MTEDSDAKILYAKETFLDKILS